MRDPHFFPNHLRPRLDLTITDAGKDFPLVSQTRQRVGKIISHVGQAVCVAARNGLVRPDLALLALQDLFDCLSDYYYEHSYSNRESYDRKLKREITASEEWRGFLKELAEVAEAPKLHGNKSGQSLPVTDQEDRPASGGVRNLPSPSPAGESEDPIAVERAALLRAYRAECSARRGIRITDEMIAKAANPGRWNERTPVQRWKRNDSRCTPADDVKIRAMLKKKPHLE